MAAPATVTTIDTLDIPFLGVSIGEARKAVISIVLLVAAVIGVLITGYDPSFTDAVVVFTGAGLGVIGVYMTKNSSPDDLGKAVTQLIAAALTIVGYFTTVDPNTVEQLYMIGTAAVSVYAVFRVRNLTPEAVTKKKRSLAARG